MFDKLVVSTAHRRSARTLKFFFVTSIIYLSVLGCAFAVSILVASPKLADTSALTELIAIPVASGGVQHTPRLPAASAKPDLYHVQSLDQIAGHTNTSHPPIIQRADLPSIETSSFGDAFSGGGGPGLPGAPGLAGRESNSINVGEPSRPDPPAPSPRRDEQVDRPVRVSSTVLQGKAVERRTPTYPQLARQIHLQGEVSVEVMISPAGRVESARVVSGHPMLAQCAREAALGWRFGPTLLNNTPVRVTGVIIFVFKLND